MCDHSCSCGSQQATLPPVKTDNTLTADDGREALKDHVIDKANAARRMLGGHVDLAGIERLMQDRACVRFPVTYGFDAAPLEQGEFAYMAPLGPSPSEGFRLFIHPRFEGCDEVLPMLIAYHLVRVNYGDIASHVEAEWYAATLLGMGVDDYYETLCRLVDTAA